LALAPQIEVIMLKETSSKNL